MMVLQAQANFMKTAGTNPGLAPTQSPLVPPSPLSVEDLSNLLAVQEGQVKIWIPMLSFFLTISDFLKMKIDSLGLMLKVGGGTVSDLPTADIVASTLQV